MTYYCNSVHPYSNVTTVAVHPICAVTSLAVHPICDVINLDMGHILTYRVNYNSGPDIYILINPQLRDVYGQIYSSAVARGLYLNINIEGAKRPRYLYDT